MYSNNKRSFNYDYIKNCKKRTENIVQDNTNEIQETLPKNEELENTTIDEVVYNIPENSLITNQEPTCNNYDLDNNISKVQDSKDDNFILSDTSYTDSNSDFIYENIYDEEFDLNAYQKNKLGYYFRCECGAIPCSFEDGGYFILANPKNSEVNLFLNVSYNTNLSEIPLQASAYYFGKIKGDLKETKKIISGNPYTKDTIKSKAKIFYGFDAELLRGVNTYTFSIEPFSTFKDIPSGSIIIPPGYIHIVKVCSSYENKTGLCCASFAWWEKSIDEDI